MYIYVKRVLDILILIIFSPIWLPIMLALSLAVKLSSQGPVFFKQKRIGKNCTTFTIYKFRSMYTEAPKDTPTHLLKNPQAFITPVGKFLRKFSLDELPQLINILKGQITLVGPRPALWNQDDLIAEREKYNVNSITPGLTGLAQIKGRDELSIPAKVQYDAEYLAKMGPLTDFMIMLKTFFAVFKSKGVVEGGTGAMKQSNDSPTSQKETGETSSCITDEGGKQMKFSIPSVEVKSRRRKLLLLLADFLVITISYMFSWLILMRRISLANHLDLMLVSAVIFVAVFFIVFLLSGMYGSVWRYADVYEFIRCMIATVVAAAIFLLITWTWLSSPQAPMRIPLTVYFLSSLMAGMGTLFVRMFYRAYRTSRTGSYKGLGMKKTMIVGAGKTGTAILQHFNDAHRQYEVICFADDDNDKIGRRINSVKVEGGTKDIPKLAEKHGIQVIIIALSSTSGDKLKHITHLCAKTKCQLKKVADMRGLVANPQAYAKQVLDVSIEDLLGRDEVDIGAEAFEYLAGKKVMVTGAGGSIGSELCRQIVMQNPKCLVMVDIAENGLYDIQQELISNNCIDGISMHCEVATIRDAAKTNLLFERHKPDIVYHAAAHKHVPLMESAPEEAVKNNIYGTLNVARHAAKHGVERFVMISTDKAVNPTNVMGATKRVCEMIIQCMAQVSETRFVAVRFGNVLGSDGSLLPLLKSQIAQGGPVTVTHPDIIRYFMTISEAVSLVLTAGEMAQGGEIFVLDMGEPVKILDLAESLIRLSGYEPYKDIDISFIGLRPGEKLYEELLMDEEGMRKTPNRKVFIGSPLDISPDYLFSFLEKMNPAAQENKSKDLVNRLYDLVPGFESKKLEEA